MIDRYETVLKTKKVFSGFDGYTDFLYSVIQKETNGKKQKFQLSKEFVKDLSAAAGKSSEYEIVLKYKKIGGNAPLLSIGMATMGANVSCVGLFDDDRRNFADRLKGSLQLLSLGPPATTIALEFEDCKFMLADCGNLNLINFQNIEEKIGLETIKEQITEADLISVVNWSAVANVKSILEKILISENEKKSIRCKNLFLDLSDVKAKDINEIEEYFQVIERIKRCWDITTCLSVNENELRALANKFRVNKGTEKETIQSVRQLCRIDELILHAMDNAVFCSKEKLITVEKNICKKPVLTTGAGDNFNAGICVGKLLDLTPEMQLKVGNNAAEFYVANGYSGNLEQIFDMNIV